MLTSLVIAVLWGGNLTAVFPVVDVIMNDQSLPQWIDQKIAESDREVSEDRPLAGAARKAQVERRRSRQTANSPPKSNTARPSWQQHMKQSADTWNDVQIAEKTRLENFIARLEALRNLPPQITCFPKSSRRSARYQRHRTVYSQRADRFRLDRPRRPSLDAHHAVPHAAGRVPGSCSCAPS